MRKRRSGRGIGVIVGGHIDRLHRSDRALLRRRDAFLQFTHFGGEVRLITHRARHAAEQRRHFRTRLREAENIVDEEQHVLAFLIAEIFGDGEAGQTHAQARPGRLGHLAIDQRDLRFGPILRIDDAGFLHFHPEVIAFAGALAHAGKHRNAAVLHGDVVDEFLDDDRLADARAAEQTDLSAAKIRLKQIDDLDAGLEHFKARRLVFKRRRLAVNRITLLGVDRAHLIHRLRRARSARGRASACPRER